MGVGETLKGFYRACEDKYYAFIDWLEEKGLSLYPLIDKIEERNIPSFPVMVAILALIVAGIFFGVGMLTGAEAKVTFTVLDKETGVPIDGAKVTLKTVSGAEVSGTTKADGTVLLSVPAGKVDVTVEKSGYKDGTLSFDAAGAMEKEIELEIGIVMLSRTIQVLKAGTSQLISEDVTIRFTCSNEEADFDELKTVSEGKIDLQVPSNCGSLVASPVSGFTAPNGTLDIENASPQLFLEPVETNTGTINVFVENAAGEALSGITVIINNEQGILAGTQYSNAAGTAAFVNVPTGKYYAVVHDSQGRYADFDSSMLGTAGVKELVKDAVVSFDVELQPATVGKVKVLAKDSVSRQPVDNAKVLLKKGGSAIDTGYTSAEGTVEFSVGENVEYSLEIDADAYIIAVVAKVFASESFNEVLLEPATADNTQVLDVEVVDSRQKPVEEARLVLKKADGTIFANNVVTGADGKGAFTNLPLGTYYVYAVKKGFEGRNSDPITIKPRQENKVVVVLPIGFGNIEAVVLNDEMRPVQGAVVEAIGVVGNAKEQEEITNLEGKAVFNFRADKVVFFKVDADGFLPYYSIAVSPDADSTVALQIALAKDSGKLEVKLLGLYNGEDIAPNELTPGEKYTARLVLLVPKNSRFDEAGLHLRVGNAEQGKTNIMEEDSLYLKNMFASSANILRGTSFTPPKGYATDSTHLTTGDSKWANVMWKNVAQGAYAVEAEVQVSEAAQLGQLLYISYRGWGKSGSYVRFPADNALAGSDSTAEKQALYAKTNDRAYTAGPSSLCGINFCKTFSIEDTARNLKVSVVREYGAAIGTTYKLNFTISSTAEQAFTNSSIEFGSKGDGLRFGKYLITDTVGIRSEGSVQGYLLSKDIGDMRKESSVSGSIEFKTEKEGSNALTITIKSNNQPVLSEAIDIRVAAAEQLQLSIIPKEIIPGIDNKILVRASDKKGEPVSNAIATVMINDALVTATETNGSGEMSFTLETPAAGSVLSIKAEKTGYKPAEFKATIDSSILIVTPPEISNKLDIGANEIENQLWLDNSTATGLLISKLKFSSDFKDLVEFEWDDDYIGRKIAANSDLNAFLSTRLTQKGMLVDKPVKLEGSLSIYLLSQELQQTFVQNVPVIVRIGLGKNVENLKCLEITPVKWEVITASDQGATEEFMLKNNCIVDGSKIALAKLEAKLTAGKDNALGKFIVSSDDLPGANSITLTENFSKIADALPAGFEGKIRVQFVPNSEIDSGNAKMSIELMATHNAIKGEEKIGAKLPVTAYVSNLEKCIEVIAEEPLTVETMPLNTGYGQYGGSYNPYSQGGYGGYGAGSYGYGGITGTGGGYLGGSAYPSANYSSPYYTNYYNTNQDNAWRYGLGENSFVVKNNCSMAVEANLDIPSRLRADKEKFELQPNATGKVTVESGYRMGSYEIGVFAKRKGSEDKAQKIDSVDVIVKRAGEIDEECIQLSTTKIKMNDFIGRPVNEQIFNYCYDVGVRLPSAGNVITFGCKLSGQPMNTYKLEEESQAQKAGKEDASESTAFLADGVVGTVGQPVNPAAGQAIGAPPWQGGISQQGYANYGGAYSQDYGYGSNCELIDSVYIVDTSTSGGEDGKTIQTVEFEIKPALNYRKMLCQFQSQLPFQTIFGLRMMISQSFYRVEVDSSANVHYYNPFGGASNKYFKVTLEDLWGIGDTVDECMYQAGAATMSLERLLKCKEKGKMAEIGEMVKTNALDLSAKGYLKGFVPQEQFNGDTFIYRTDPDVLNIPPGASHDSIVKIMPAEIKDSSGVKISFKPVPMDCPLPYSGGNWGIQMTVDRSAMPDNIGCAKIESQVTINVERRTYWGDQPKPITMPVKVWVLNRGINASEPSFDAAKCTGAVVPPITTTKCQSGGETDAKTATKYGFDRLLLEWSWDKIAKDQCDYRGDAKEKAAKADTTDKGMFCDAVQFSIELNKKAEEVKKFAEKIDLKENESKIREIMGIITMDVPGEYKKSADLLRWVKKQTIIIDNSEGTGKEKSLVFFLNKNNGLLENEKIAKGGMATDIDIVAGTSTDLSYKVDRMASILAELQANEGIDEDSIVLLFERTDDLDSSIYSYFGFEYYEGLGKYVWTFKEFKKFHEELSSAIKSIGTASNKCFDKDNNPAQKAEDAVMCKFSSIADDSDETDVYMDTHLRPILNANLKVVAGIRDSAELKADSGLGKKVMAEAKDIDSAKVPTGYASFREFYEKAIDFNALLVRDGYSSDLRKDFDSYYRSASEKAPTTLNATGFGGENWTFNGEEKYALPNAGLYNVLINANFSDQQNLAWDVEFKPLKTLGEIDSVLAKGTAYAKNYFLSLPFDGQVGKGGDRAGYGIVLNNNGENQLLLYKETPGINVVGFPIVTGTGMGGNSIFSLNYGNTFEKTNSGKILSVSQNTIEFNPSSAAVANVSMAARQAAGPEGIVYNLSTMNSDQVPTADATTGKVTSWFTWKTVGQQSETFKDQGFAALQAQALCPEIQVDGYHGFMKDFAGTQQFKGIAFVPFKAQYFMQVLCTQGSAEASAIGTIQHNAGFASQPLQLNETANLEYGTLKHYIDSIENSTVCFAGTETSAALAWNAEQLLK